MTVEELARLLSDVETENGKPIALSRYGWHKVEIDGKNYLMALTPDEIRAEHAKLGWDGDPEVLYGGCAGRYDNTVCYKNGDKCKGYCKTRSITNGWICVCES